MRNRLSSIVKLLLAAGLSASATLALIEIGLRTLPPIRYEWDVQQALPGLKEQIVYARNRFGMRSLSMTTRAKPPNTIRILCLGASTTDQPTQSTPDTWSGRLESELNANSDVRIEVAAYGRGGLRASNLLGWAKENLERFEPDVVIILLGINDLSWNGYPGYTYSPGPRAATLSERTWSWLRTYSRTAQTAESIVQRFRHGSTLEWHSANLAGLSAQLLNYPYLETLERDPDPIVEFEDSVAGLLQLAKQAQIEAVVVAQPVLWKPDMSEAERAVLWFPAWTQLGPMRVNPSVLAREMERYNQRLEALAAEQRTHFIPAADLLPRTLEYFIDDCHLTDLGSVRLAEILEPRVAEIVGQIVARRRPKTEASR